MKDDVETAQKLMAISHEITKYTQKMEDFILSEEVPKSELAYYEAKEIACEVLKAEGKTVGEVTLMIKGRIGQALFRKRSAEIKLRFFQDKTRTLEKQLSAYQSVNKKFSMI